MRVPAMRSALLIAACLSATHATIAEEARYNRVSFTESAQASVDNDVLVAVLQAQAEGREAAPPADEVNRTVDWAIGLAKARDGVKVQTLGYQSRPIYDKQEIRGWRVSQALRLESRDSRALGTLIGELQAKMQVQSIDYELSDDQRRAQIAELTTRALGRFQARADLVAKALGRDGYRLVQVTIDDSRDRPVPIARSLAMEAMPAAAPPAPARIEAGTQEIGVSVFGEIELSTD